MLNTVSTSSLSMYQQCPLQFRFRYIDNLKSEVAKNYAAIFGTAIHELLETMYKEQKFTKEFLISNWVPIFRKVCKKEEIIFNNAGHEQFYINDGFKIINKYYKIAKDNGFLRPALFLEKHFRVPLKTFFLTGKIDIILDVNNQVIILDYKTSKLEDKDIHNNNQLTFYSWAAHKLDIKENRVGLFYLRLGKIIYSTRNRTDYLKLAKEVIVTMNKIKKGKFLPTWNCKWCQFPDSCRNWINDHHKISIDLLQEDL